MTKWYTVTLGVTFACGYVFVLSCLAAALLPYRAKALYEASPGAKYKLAGIPLVTIFGVIGFIFGAAAVVAFLVKKGYGLTRRLAVADVRDRGRHLRLRPGRLLDRPRLPGGKGIDVSYAFLEVPPE